MRVVSWNVNGLRALFNKGLDPLSVLPAELVALQEIKLRPEQLPEERRLPAGWHVAWAPAEKAGYSGVALFSRRRPDEWRHGLGEAAFDAEGRTITAILGRVAVVGAYFPNSQDGGRRLPFKLGYCAAMERHLAGLRREGLATVLVGDYNIAHRPIDLARPQANEQSPGYLPEERAWMQHYVTELGYRDVLREAQPETPGLYTWWSYRAGARARNVGWRIDYATVSPDLAERVCACAIHPEIAGSDHCPVSIEVADQAG